MRSRRPSGTSWRLVIGASALALTAALAACVPTEMGPPDMRDVEEHLGLRVGFVPEGCQPAGLSGDGRGRAFRAGFDCPGGVTLDIERLDRALLDHDVVAIAPSPTDQGRIEWRIPDDEVIRVTSAGVDAGELLQVAESIELRDR